VVVQRRAEADEFCPGGDPVRAHACDGHLNMRLKYMI
jgi:hypothetical protein